MSALLTRISWSTITGSREDDWVDRLNHLWTVCILSLLLIFVTSSQYVGDPIQCWCPAEFTIAHVNYAKSYCWISNTYYIPMTEQIPTNTDWRNEKEIPYYQWVPIILLLQALLFKLPNIIWQLLSNTSGVHMEKICEMINQVHLGKVEEQETIANQIALCINSWLLSARHYHSNCLVRLRQCLLNMCCFCCSRQQGHFLTGLYLFIKLLYCVNCVSQFFILSSFLDIDFGSFGVEVLGNIYMNRESLVRFPRQTLCDLNVRSISKSRLYTIQCILPINLFNEKIFMFLWFWLLFVATLTILNFLNWLRFVTFHQGRRSFVLKHICAADQKMTTPEKRLMKKFVNQYLRDDGVFLLRIIAKNSAYVTLDNVIRQLWKMFQLQQCETTTAPTLTVIADNAVNKNISKAS